MLGFVIGTACVIGLVKLARGGGCGWHGRRHGCHGGCSHGHRWGEHYRDAGERGGDDGHAWFSSGGFGERWFLRRVFERLDTTPGQERVIADALRELREKGREAKDRMRASREDIARVMRSESFDETALAESIARQDEAIDTLRKSGIDALAKVHQALEPSQRERLAEMISRGAGGFFGGHRGHGRRDTHV